MTFAGKSELTKKKPTKFDKLSAVFKHVAQEFAKIDDLQIQQLGKLFGRSIDLPPEGLMDGDRKVRPSEIAVGLEQGLRDLLTMVASAEEHIRKPAMAALSDAIVAHYPDFVERELKKLDKVMARGYIRTESEYYLMQARLDMIEGAPENEAELDRIYTMMDSYGE